MDEKNSEKPVEVVETNPAEQLEKLSEKNKSAEEERRVTIEKESSEAAVKEDPGRVAPVSNEGKSLLDALVKASMKTVPDVTKNVRDVTSLVNLLKEDKITEDAFIGLYKGMADDVNKLIHRRGEVIAEIEAAAKGYRSFLISVQQDMKLLNIRARAATLKRDIDDYTHMRRDGAEEAARWGNSERLNDSAELEKLMAAVKDCSDALAELDLSEGVKDKMQNSMQEALSRLKETSSSR